MQNQVISHTGPAAGLNSLISVEGNNKAGYIHVITGKNTQSKSYVCELRVENGSFSNGTTANYAISLTPADANAAEHLSNVFCWISAHNSFQIVAINQKLIPESEYRWYYIVVPY